MNTFLENPLLTIFLLGTITGYIFAVPILISITIVSGVFAMIYVIPTLKTPIARATCSIVWYYWIFLNVPMWLVHFGVIYFTWLKDFFPEYIFK